jgi:hypothetical protein
MLSKQLHNLDTVLFIVYGIEGDVGWLAVTRRIREDPHSIPELEDSEHYRFFGGALWERAELQEICTVT